MEIHFDSQILKKWKENNVKNISIAIIARWCAGNKIQITEWTIDGNAVHIYESLSIHYEKKYESVLNGSRLTWTGKKWILTSLSIHARCGCGSSFSLKSGNPLQDKLTQIKLAMKQKRDGIHKI